MDRQIRLSGIEPDSHRYKQWALTNRRQSQKTMIPQIHRLGGGMNNTH